MKVFKHLTALSKTLNRIFIPSIQPNDFVWNYLNVQDKSNLKNLEGLTVEIEAYYKATNKEINKD